MRAQRICLLLAMLLIAASPAVAQPFIYAVTEGDTVAGDDQCPVNPCRGPRLVITDARTGTIVNPHDDDIGVLNDESGVAVAITPDGRQAYIGLWRLGTPKTVDRVVVIDTATNLPIRSIEMDKGLWDLVASPDGTRVYAAHAHARSIWVISTATGAVTERLSMVRPAGALAVSPDGTRLYVASLPFSGLDVVDTTTFQVQRVGPGGTASDIAVAPDGERIFAAIPDYLRIAIVDAVSFAVTERDFHPLKPLRLLPTKDGTRLFVTFASDPGPPAAGAGFAMLDLTTNDYTVFATDGTVGGNLVGSPDGSRVFVRGTTSPSPVLFVAESVTGTVLGTIPGGGADMAATDRDGCLFALPAYSALFGPAGGSGTIAVPAPAGCAWAVQNVPDAAVAQFTSPTSGSGPGTVTYVVSPQLPGASTARVTDVRVAGQTVRITQTQPRMYIDTPGTGSTLTQPVTLAGWAIDIDGSSYDAGNPYSPNTGPGVDAVHVWAYPQTGSSLLPRFVGVASYGGERLDVGDIFGDQYRASSFSLQVRGLPPGDYLMAVHAHSARTGVFNNVATVMVTIGAEPLMSLDLPANGATVSPPFAVAGWAFDAAASAGPGVDAIHVWAFPAVGGAPVFLGVASYGVERPDVGAIFGAEVTNSGFYLSVDRLTPGDYTINAYAHSAVSGTFATWRSTSVRVARPQQIRIETVARGSGTGSVVVTGWAIDQDALVGTGVDAVHVWAFPVAGGPPTWIAAASLGGTRPDVAAVFGAQFSAAGYTAIGVLGVGTFHVVAYKHSAVTGRFDEADVVTCTLGFFGACVQ